MLNEFNEGGSHEQNKLGGIPQGMGSNGMINTVEEGETKKDSFIYSNRITLTPQVIAQFNLPKSLLGKTAADATKLINNKFEGRNSKLDNNTKKAFLDRIAEAQETVKAEEQSKIQEAMQINSTEVPDMMNGQIPQGMEEYSQPQQPMAYGGKMSQNQMLFGGNSQQGQMAGDMTGQVATTAADMFFPGSGQFLKMGDQFGTQVGNMIGGDKGEQIGGLISPMGTLKGIGTSIATGNINDIPGIGLFGGKTTKQKEIQKMKFNKDMFESNSKISDFKYGGNMYEGGGELKPWQLPSSKMTDDPSFNGGFGFKNMTGIPYATELPLDQQINIKSSYNPNSFYKQSFNQMGRPQISNDLGYTSKLNYNDPDTVNLSPEQLQENNISENIKARMFGPQATGHYEGEMYDGSKVGKIASKVGQYVKDNYGNALRYAPIAMNAYQLAKMGKPEVETLDRLNNRYNPQYMDEKALTNQINAETNYTANALANAANGSLGSLSNNILGMQLNKTKALSDAYSKVADVNRNEDKTAQQFNLGVDQVNIGQSNMEKDINAKNRGAFKTEKSRLLGQMGTDLGNIGKETVYKKLAKEAFGYTYDGEYVRDDKGKVVNNPDTGKPLTKEELEKTKKYAQTFNTLGKREFGSLSLNNQNTKE